MIKYCPICGELLSTHLYYGSISEIICKKCCLKDRSRFYIMYRSGFQITVSITININGIYYNLVSNFVTFKTFIHIIDSGPEFDCPHCSITTIFSMNKFIEYSSLEESTNIINRLLKVKAFI